MHGAHAERGHATGGQTAEQTTPPPDMVESHPNGQTRCGDGDQYDPVAPPGLDAFLGPVIQQEQRHQSQHANAERRKREPRVVLAEDATDDIEDGKCCPPGNRIGTGALRDV